MTIPCCRRLSGNCSPPGRFHTFEAARRQFLASLDEAQPGSAIRGNRKKMVTLYVI
jgi:hypothetical protein